VDKNRTEDIDAQSEQSFPASDPPSHTPVTGVGEAATDTKSGGSWKKKLAALGAGSVAFAAGMWTFRRRQRAKRNLLPD
jgi:hypothetical protein